MYLLQIICECGILKVGAIHDTSENMFWYAPKYEYLVQTRRALKNAVWMGMMKAQE